MTTKIFVSDSHVRAGLACFAPKLMRAIANPCPETTGFVGNPRYNHGDQLTLSVVRMTPTECVLWDEFFGLDATVGRSVQDGKLRVVNGTGYELVKIDEGLQQARLAPFDNSARSYWIKPTAYIGFSNGGIYNAFVSLDVYVKDAQGCWGVEKVNSIYHPSQIADTSVWFNTALAGDENSIQIMDTRPNSLMLGAVVNTPHKLNMLVVPNDARLRFFFWQLYRLTVPRCWLLWRRGLL